MPDRLAYDDAMRFSSARLKVTDSELKKGKVEMVSIQTKAGTLMRPWGIEGGFAVVYKFRTKSGKYRALRCFRVTMNNDMQFRYERIGAYFAAHIPDITAEFKYHNDGIRVGESRLMQSKLYPLIEMEWIEGVTLLEKVDEMCRKRDRASLKELTDQWLALCSSLRMASIAHGDLSGSNVMVRADGRLVLVDYDGVYIPEFASLQQVTLGTIDYQHPQMSQRLFSERMDDFSALVIYSALLALQVQPTLWDKYARKDSWGMLPGSLLFVKEDFQAPDLSSLFRDLENMADPQVTVAVQELRRACQQSIDQVRIPLHIIDIDNGEKQALALLEQAIMADDDEQIAMHWIPILENYGSAQLHYSRVSLAQQRLRALKDFRDALNSGRPQQIVTAHNQILDSIININVEERERLALARKFIQAYNDDDDQALSSVYGEIQKSGYNRFFSFDIQEMERISLARQREEALVKFRLALMGKSIQQIVVAYDPVLNDSRSVTPEERDLLELAQRFIQAFNNDDDATLVSLCDAIQNSFVFTVTEQQRITLARQRHAMLTKLQTDVMTDGKDLSRVKTYMLLLAVPHEPIPVGGNLKVAVYLSLADSNVDGGYVFNTSGDEAMIGEINMFLDAPGFQLDGTNTASLPLGLSTDGTSPLNVLQVAHFNLTALRPGKAKITVELYQGSTFETALIAEVPITQVDTAIFPKPRIATHPSPILRPDLTLQVSTDWNETGSACTFRFSLFSSRSLLLPVDGVDYRSNLLPGRWIEQVHGWLGSILEESTGGLPEDIHSRMISFGQHLFQHAFPPELQSEIRHLAQFKQMFSLLLLVHCG